jgi:hypothetical protein
MMKSLAQFHLDGSELVSQSLNVLIIFIRSSSLLDLVGVFL